MVNYFYYKITEHKITVAIRFCQICQELKK